MEVRRRHGHGKSKKLTVYQNFDVGAFETNGESLTLQTWISNEDTSYDFKLTRNEIKDLVDNFSRFLSQTKGTK